ncbi:histone-lysine N-methyltransferase SMYD3-like [Amphiura filiformis]|uniref:histone-lysine N-methyltransferase SMYD3-like n=1 Tax=Amphiura filiformis TaxID=82378 RepID=UPI003B212D01
MAVNHIHEGVEIFECSSRGRGVRASQTLPSGTCLVRENPLACVLFSQEFRRRCENCLQKREKLKVCGGCNEVRYCSKKCQSVGWIDHQYECRYKRKNKQRTLPPWSSARVMIRIIHQQNKRQKKKHKHGASEPSRNFPTTVDDLCNGELSSNEEMQSHYSQAAASLFDFVSSETVHGWNADQIGVLYAKLQVNGFCLLDAETRKPIGEVIYTRSALFNHSCAPNCCFVFNHSIIEVRNIRDIKPGEECSINYVNLLKPMAKRQRDLYDVYGFWCDCTRCQQNQEEADEESGDSTASDEAEQLGDKLLRNIEDTEVTENILYCSFTSILFHKDLLMEVLKPKRYIFSGGLL